LGYRQEFAEAAEHNIEKWNKPGVKTVVTSCAYGYGSMKLYYPRIGKGMKFEVLHITEYLDRLIKVGKLIAESKFNEAVGFTKMDDRLLRFCLREKITSGGRCS
jgi:Fe-S oxidoreductase